MQQQHHIEHNDNGELKYIIPYYNCLSYSTNHRRCCRWCKEAITAAAAREKRLLMGPWSTKSWLILKFDKLMLLVTDKFFDGHMNMEQELRQRLLFVHHVSTGERSLIAGSQLACSLELQFWTVPNDQPNEMPEHPVLKLLVQMPQSWTLRVYFALLFDNTQWNIGKKCHSSSVEQVNGPFNILNNIHYLCVMMLSSTVS
jgi:hypothetical protein